MGQSTVIVPNRHNYYNDESFIRPDPMRGTLRDPFGRRLTRVSIDLLAALHAELARQFGDAAGEYLYKLGRRWGEGDFAAFARRAPREFGVLTLEQMHFNVMLETWRWPFTAAGWGAWRYDFRRARQGLPVVDLTDSAVVAALGSAAHPTCHLYAGLFAAAFSALARRELVAVELQCGATGAPECRFLVTNAPRAAAAVKLREEKLSMDEVLERLAEPGAKPEASGDSAT